MHQRRHSKPSACIHAQQRAALLLHVPRQRPQCLVAIRVWHQSTTSPRQGKLRGIAPHARCVSPALGSNLAYAAKVCTRGLLGARYSKALHV
jgi:hypothetical protein